MSIVIGCSGHKPSRLPWCGFLIFLLLGVPADISAGQRQDSILPVDPNSPYFLVGLSQQVNFTLFDPMLNRPGNDLADLLTGLPKGSTSVKVLKKIPFRLDGVILVGAKVTGSTDRGMVSLPQKVEGIPVGRKAEHLHFLHATHFGQSGSVKIGSYIVHYADQSRAEIPIRLGDDVIDWWGRVEEAALSATNRAGAAATHPNAPIGTWSGWDRGLQPASKSIVWRGLNNAAAGFGYHICLFMKTWTNPYPEREIACVDMVSGDQPPGLLSPAPFLVGLTGEMDVEFHKRQEGKGPPVLQKPSAKPAP
jgi:hypothetical protein